MMEQHSLFITLFRSLCTTKYEIIALFMLFVSNKQRKRKERNTKRLKPTTKHVARPLWTGMRNKFRFAFNFMEFHFSTVWMFDEIMFEHCLCHKNWPNRKLKANSSLVPLSGVFMFVQERYSINQCGQRLMLNFGFAFHHLVWPLSAAIGRCLSTFLILYSIRLLAWNTIKWSH